MVIPGWKNRGFVPAMTRPTRHVICDCLTFELPSPEIKNKRGNRARMSGCRYDLLVLGKSSQIGDFYLASDEWVLFLVRGGWSCPASMRLLIRKDHQTGNDPVHRSDREESEPQILLKAGRRSSDDLRRPQTGVWCDDDLDRCSPGRRLVR